MYRKWKHKRQAVHYVVWEKDGSYNYVFNYDNMMKFILDTSNSLAKFNFGYAEHIYRSLNKNSIIIVDEIHKLNPSKLIIQAKEYYKKHLSQATKSWWSDAFEYPDKTWQNNYLSLDFDESAFYFNPKWGYLLKNTKQNRKCHRQVAYKPPKHIWAKVRYAHSREASMRDWDEDYTQYIKKKNRYSKQDKVVGWWDDYARCRKSTGWKESSKRKHQYKNY